jgi:hypothetical protein
MSDHGHSGHGDAGAGTSDAVDYGKVVGVGVSSLVIFALSIWWSTTIWHGEMDRTQAIGGKAKEIDTTRTEIGIVDQVPFTSDRRLPLWRAARKAELESYGWVDRAKGTVHIPIEAAMERVVGGTMPAGAPR